MKNLLCAFLASILAMSLASCMFIRPRGQTETRLQEFRSAVTHLKYKGASCTAFHIGDNLFITAAHCFQDELGTSEFSPKEVLMIDENNFHFNPQIVKFDNDADLVLMKTYKFHGATLQLWDPLLDGPLASGQEMMVMGYPGYFSTEFTFERGFVKIPLLRIPNFKSSFVVSERDCWPGESGGPAISLENGKVIGMNDMLVERIQWFDMSRHLHATITFFVSYKSIRQFISAK